MAGKPSVRKGPIGITGCPIGHGLYALVILGVLDLFYLSVCLFDIAANFIHCFTTVSI